MSVGEALREARERRGLSIEQVAAATRIRGTLIRAIENDDFAPCGGSVYARGHIRSIGHVVGVDPEPLIGEYDAAHGGPPGGPPPLAVGAFDYRVDPNARPRRPNWAVAAVVTLLVIIGAAAYALASSGSGAPRLRATGTHHPKSPMPSQSPATHSPSPGPSRLATGATTVQIRVTSAVSWCSVATPAGVTLFQGDLTAGESRTFRDLRGLILVLGNAPVVDLLVNGQSEGAIPSQGNVARFTVAASGRLIPASGVPTPAGTPATTAAVAG
jgi:cytoskeleton protein RodZ